MFRDPEDSSVRLVLTEGVPLLDISEDRLTRIKKWLQFCVEQEGVTQAWLGRVEPDQSIYWVVNYPPETLPIRVTDEILQTVVQTGEVYTFNDHEELISGAVFPCIHNGHVIGLLGLVSDQTGYFKPGMIPWIKALTKTISDDLFEYGQGSGVDQTEYQITRALQSSLDVYDALPTVLEALAALLKADAVTVLGYHLPSQRFKLIATHGLDTSILAKLNLYFETGLAGKKVDAHQPVWIGDLQTSPLHSRPINRLDEEGFRGYLGLPLIGYNDLVGVIEVLWRKPQYAKTWNLGFLEEMAEQIAFAFHRTSILRDLRQRNEELQTRYNAMIEGLSRALELRDLETEGHTRRVSELTMQLVKHAQIPADEWDSIRQGALLHDIGKLGIPDAILLKPGSLTPRERKVMQQHVLHGYNILVPIIGSRHTLDITLYHHENWDGKGYPYGLQAEQIPQVARLFAVVEVFDALTSDRPYRAAWSHSQVLQYIKVQAGRQFDPHVVEIFLEIAGEISQF
jgi:response regulator RpfG family c-di-GMP phosphodiesterase